MKKTLCIALCALTLLALAACGAEQSAQEGAQFTPGTAAPEPYEPGAKLEISAPTLDDAEFICLLGAGKHQVDCRRATGLLARGKG